MRIFILIALLATLGTTMTAENWPQWRGPQLNGVSAETNLPVTWDSLASLLMII